MQDIVFSLDLKTLGLLFLLVFPLYWLLLRKQIFFWFDPLLIFIFFNSISIAFVIYLYFFMHSIKLEYLIDFSLCILGFIAGLLLGGRRGLIVFNFPKSGSKIINDSQNYWNLVDVFMVISLGIMILSNLIMLAVKGTLPIFSSNPSVAKIELYTGGWGLVKRINLSLVNYVLAIPLIKIFHPFFKITDKQKLFYFSCLAACVIVMISMGSKSSLLIILNLLFAIILINKSVGRTPGNHKRSLLNRVIILKWAKYIFIAAFLFMVVIILLSGLQTSAADAFITRLVASGDAFYFFYVYDIASDFHQTALDYIPHFFNPILAMLRLQDYEFALGARIINYSLETPLDAASTFGPNAQHPLEGLVYFGKYGAPFYSLLIGYLISAIRINLLRRMGPYPNSLMMAIYVILSSMVITAATDVPLFLQILYDTLLFGILILIPSDALLKVMTTKNKSTNANKCMHSNL